MSNYVVTTNFAAKDALAHGNPAKVAKGSEISTEFNNIATAVATKEDLANKNVNSGYAGLDSTARIAKAQAPSTTAYTDASNTFLLTQNVAPASGSGLIVNGQTASYAVNITNGAGSGSFGLLVSAGTSSSDNAFTIDNNAGTSQFFQIRGDGAGFFSNASTNAPFAFQGTGAVGIGGNLGVTGSITAGSGFAGNGGSITALNASNLSAGTVPLARLGTGGATNVGTWLRGDNSWANVDWSILTGTQTAAMVPALDTSKITTGTFADARIASSNVTQYQGSLTIGTGQITGTLADARLVASNVTQFNSSINSRNITAKSGISKTLQNGGTASGGADGDIIYIY